MTLFSLRDESMLGFKVSDNKEISFLPVKVAEKFPNLEIYSASRAVVKEVWKKNFESLKYLKVLYLNNNQLKRLPNDVFADLKELRVIDLGKNSTK